MNETITRVDVFNGPMGGYGFRRGNWTAKTSNHRIITFYASIPHNIPLYPDQEKLITDYAEKALISGNYEVI